MGSEPPSGAGGKPTPTLYGDRPVYSVAAFNQGVAGWLERLPNVWVEGGGEVAECCDRPSAGRWRSRRCKDADGAASLPAVITRARLEQIDPPLVAGDRVHALGRSGAVRRRGEVSFRDPRMERFGLGMVLRRIEELRETLAAEGLFAQERKQPLPFLPRTIGLICGTDAAARRDVVETATRRYPPARFGSSRRPSRAPRRRALIGGALRLLDFDPEVDVIVLARGGGDFEDLLPFSDERVIRAVADCATPVVSAIGHEEDTPLVDLAADVRAGTPSLAGRLVVPDYAARSRPSSTPCSHAVAALSSRRPPGPASGWRCWSDVRPSPTPRAGSPPGGRRCCWPAPPSTAGPSSASSASAAGWAPLETACGCSARPRRSSAGMRSCRTAAAPSSARAPRSPPATRSPCGSPPAG